MSDQKHEINLTLEKLFYDNDYKRLPKELSSFYTRPLYYGTRQQIGGINETRSD